MTQSSRTRLRGVLLVEDRRTERFLRRLLESLGVDVSRFRFKVAPEGRGAAEAWVRKNYPGEVKTLRSKNYQKDLCLIAACDGDRVGLSGRLAEFDDELRAAKLNSKQTDEQIALLVPTWSIESWLLCLIGHTDLNEARGPQDGSRTWKLVYEAETQGREGASLKLAVANWHQVGGLPSMESARAELASLTTRSGAH